jgi:hypothetical protein
MQKIKIFLIWSLAPYITILIIFILLCLVLVSPLFLVFIIYIKQYDKKYKMYREFFQKLSLRSRDEVRK